MIDMFFFVIDYLSVCLSSRRHGSVVIVGASAVWRLWELQEEEVAETWFRTTAGQHSELHLTLINTHTHEHRLT